MSVDARFERFMTMEILGRRALFSNLRLADDSVPGGLYLYGLREGEPLEECNEDGEPIAPTLSIAKSAWCDHFGTVILRDSIPEAETGEFEIGDDDWGLLGDELSLLNGIPWLSEGNPTDGPRRRGQRS